MPWAVGVYRGEVPEKNWARDWRPVKGSLVVRRDYGDRDFQLVPRAAVPFGCDPGRQRRRCGDGISSNSRNNPSTTIPVRAAQNDQEEPLSGDARLGRRGRFVQVDRFAAVPIEHTPFTDGRETPSAVPISRVSLVRQPGAVGSPLRGR
jgi:hypothetical protein